MIVIEESDLKKLENYGFIKLRANARGHKYSWKREFDNNSYYELYVNRNNRLHFHMMADKLINGCVELRIVEKMQDKIYDLIRDGIAKKVVE